MFQTLENHIFNFVFNPTPVLAAIFSKYLKTKHVVKYREVKSKSRN